MITIFTLALLLLAIHISRFDPPNFGAAPELA